jgi:Astacin (Peptidase family M12A)
MEPHRIMLVLFIAFLFTHAWGQIITPPNNVTSGFIRHPTRGVIQTSWFYTGNLVAYDGDAVFGTTAEFSRAIVNITYTSPNSTAPAPTPQPLHRERRSYPPTLDSRSNSIFPGSSGIWPGGVIRYRYFDGPTESTFASDVNAAIAEWTSNVPCLKFVKEANSNDPNGTPGIVTIMGQSGINYCLASVGASTSSSWMVLAPGGCGRAEILHEWGHIIGLIHEQKRPDANANIGFICQNLIDYPFGKSTADADNNCCGKAPGYNCCGWACQFTPEFGDYNSGDVAQNGGQFDLNSIMLYRRDAFAKSGTFTLTNGPNDHNNPQHLSSEDINRVRELYGCLAPTCPAGCNPLSNTCSFPTAEDCIYPSQKVANPRGACACRAGFKANAADGDTSKHWRLPADEGSFRVWVAQGVACDTPCNVPWGAFSCQEVTELSADCLHL